MSLVCVCLCLLLGMWIDTLKQYRWLPCYCPSTCCSLVTLPLLWLSPDSATSPIFLSGYEASQLSPSLVGQSWHIPLKCLVHTGDKLVCLNYGNDMLLYGPRAVGCSNSTSQMTFIHWSRARDCFCSIWSSTATCNSLTFWEIRLLAVLPKARMVIMKDWKQGQTASLYNGNKICSSYLYYKEMLCNNKL